MFGFHRGRNALKPDYLLSLCPVLLPGGLSPACGREQGATTASAFPSCISGALSTCSHLSCSTLASSSVLCCCCPPVSDQQMNPFPAHKRVEVLRACKSSPSWDRVKHKTFLRYLLTDVPGINGSGSWASGDVAVAEPAAASLPLSQIPNCCRKVD